MSEQQIEQKVLAYICRFQQGLWQLLVFDQEQCLAEGGYQIPGGLVKKGEASPVALEREIFEQSGLRNLMIVSQIDQYDLADPISGQTQQRQVFLALAPNEERDQWTHQELQFHWIPIAQARHLSAEQGRSVKRCIQLLFERQESH